LVVMEDTGYKFRSQDKVEQLLGIVNIIYSHDPAFEVRNSLFFNTFFNIYKENLDLIFNFFLVLSKFEKIAFIQFLIIEMFVYNVGIGRINMVYLLLSVHMLDEAIFNGES